MSRHRSEEELIAYRHGETAERAEVAVHLADCAKCRTELDRIDKLFAALSAMEVPDPDAAYEHRLWNQISPRLSEAPQSWRDVLSGWLRPKVWLAPRRLVVVGAMAAVIFAAFYAGRVSRHDAGKPEPADVSQLRERVLILAVGEHLGRSEMVLMELANAQPEGTGQKRVDISAEQRRAEELVDENRLYRQTALREGNTALASVLDELERVLLDVAHSPKEVSAAELESMQKRMEARGILFKVRVVGSELQRREETARPVPEHGGSVKGERNKA